MIEGFQMLPVGFYNRDTIEVAKELLGKYIIRKIDNEIIGVQITEVEAYKAEIDKACHAYGGKRTERTKVMFGSPGRAYVYLIYGMYYCLNVVTEEENIPSAVLIREVKPIINIEKMAKIRYDKNIEDLTNYQIRNFTNGPGKVCKTLDITKQQNDKILQTDELCLCEKQGEKEIINYKTGKRINIDYAEEAKDFLWRFTMEVKDTKKRIIKLFIRIY